MAKVQIELPAFFPFQTVIPIRITDLNYGGHVGNDSVLSIIHEARIQFLKHYGYEELKLGGASLIMRDVAIEFKRELFYGDVVKASVCATEFSKVSFELYYRFEKETEGKTVTVAIAKTGMICYNYENKKIMAVPESVKQKLSQ